MKRHRHQLRIAALFAAGLAVVATALATGALRGPAQAEAAQGAQTARVRTYYIAADEVEWDYAPAGKNLITGADFGDEENVFVQGGPDRIGSVYLKSLYREYTDQTFATRKPVPPEWQHLGSLGPLIRAEVGDTIRVVFKNTTRFPASMHPHGVFYDKSSEGAPYEDGTSGADKADDSVAPDETHTYTWQVPERAGPGPHDPSSIVWMYHSHVDESDDTNSGLMGPMIVTARGSARPDGSPIGVNREVISLYTVFDENHSNYLDHNIETYAESPATVDPSDDDFVESNLMHSVNGYVYGNGPVPTMRRGDRVRWYTMAMGTEVDLHTPHWHGQTLLWMGMRMDMVELLPMSMKVLDMRPDNPGTWHYHCHVNDHIDAGMAARFTVTP